MCPNVSLAWLVPKLEVETHLAYGQPRPTLDTETQQCYPL
jgi:hypothetical protein